MAAFSLINANIDWRNVGGSSVDLSLFGTNLTDEAYRISNTDIYQFGSLGAWSTTYGAPRMYGVRLNYHW